MASRRVSDNAGGFGGLAERVYKKRLSGEPLTFGDLMIMLADTILDQRFFESEHWKWRYGGVRYFPSAIADEAPEKIMVLQWPAALGDAVMAVCCLSALRKKYHSSKIYLLGNSTTKSIYQQSDLVDIFVENPLDSYLDHILSANRVGIKKLMEDIVALVKGLASEQFDLLFNLQVLPMTAVLAKLSCAKACVGMTLSDDGMPEIHGNIWTPYLFGVSASLMRPYNSMHRIQILQRFVENSDPCDMNPAGFIPQQHLNQVQKFFDDHGIEDHDTLIGLAPMSNAPVKTWKNYDRLMQAVSEKYPAKLIVFGSESEDRVISEVITRSGVAAIKATRFDLNELMAAISGCDLFITNDSGPMHLASLLKRKIIALFGPTSIREVGPWGTAYVVLQSNQCKECHQVSCDVRVPSCMDHIEVEDVIKAVDFFLDGDKSAKGRVSPGLTWRSSEDDDGSPSGLDALISDQYFKFLEDTGAPDTRPERPGSSRGVSSSDTKALVNFCRAFRRKIEKALSLLDTSPTMDLLIEADKDIATHCGFLKNIIVFNDMKHLDKRLRLEQNPEDYRIYYEGILKDIDRFMAQMQT